MAFDELFSAVTEGCRQTYGDRLIALAVYGSFGRGTPSPSSDLDLLLVLDEKPTSRRAFWEAFAPVEDYVRRRGFRVDLSPVVCAPTDLARRFPLLLDMTQDARILHDPQGILGTTLTGLRQRLTELGARRVPYKGAWYWDLKPDFQPGDVFSL